MGKFSLVHWLIYLAIYALPTWIVLRKAGFHWIWGALTVVVPLAPVIAIWGLALTRWPAIKNSRETP